MLHQNLNAQRPVQKAAQQKSTNPGLEQADIPVILTTS